ncbi:MAG: hypothetical protein ACD_9C00242G0002 [uncultured bacterium]|nr:MAG: hypothetical protein ACD_9C00242G0002 [uncultured bacterium]
MEKESLSKFEKEKESNIDLLLVKVDFIADTEIDLWCSQKIAESKDMASWIKKMEDDDKLKQEDIDWALKNGMIAQNTKQAVWEYVHAKDIGRRVAIEKIRNEIEQKLKFIMRQSASMLEKYLPDWKPENLVINFTTNESANFCIDVKNITIDLNRLSENPNAINDVINGITHELFHAWMEIEKSDLSERELILRGIAGEGLAVFIGNQNLENHHTERGKNYEKYKIESMKLFEEFILTKEGDDMEKYEDAFKDMGHFYIVGNEIVNAVVQKVGIEKFRELLPKIKEDASALFKEYDKII